MTKLTALLLCAGTALATFTPSTADAWGVREIPDYTLPDIAMVSADAYGPFILYNPARCAEVGPLVCSWYRTHEYGHIVLGTSDEPAADCWAARNASPSENAGAFQHFMARDDYHPRYGHAHDRAARIRMCSGG